MRAAPAIALLIVGAALCGGLLEIVTPAGEGRTAGFDEAIAALGAWLLDKFMAVARIMKKS